jgi:hypothetical protein
MRLFGNRNSNTANQTQQNAPPPPSPPALPPSAEKAENEFNNNITFLYNLLDRNNEKKGYEDALANSDVKNLEQNKGLLKDELIRSIDKATIFYEDFISEINSLIASKARADLSDQISALETKKEIAERHMTRVSAIKSILNDDNGDSTGFLLSYVVGFNNGLAAITLNNFIKTKF